MSGTGISVDEQHAIYQTARNLGFERVSAKVGGNSGSSVIAEITFKKDDTLVVVEATDGGGKYRARFNDLVHNFEPVTAFSAASALTAAKRVLDAREYVEEPIAVPA